MDSYRSSGRQLVSAGQRSLRPIHATSVKRSSPRSARASTTAPHNNIKLSKLKREQRRLAAQLNQLRGAPSPAVNSAGPPHLHGPTEGQPATAKDVTLQHLTVPRLWPATFHELTLASTAVQGGDEAAPPSPAVQRPTVLSPGAAPHSAATAPHAHSTANNSRSQPALLSAPSVPKFSVLSGLGMRPLPPSVQEVPWGGEGRGGSHSARGPLSARRTHARSCGFTSSFINNGRIVPYSDTSIGAHRRAAEREHKAMAANTSLRSARQERFELARERFEQRQAELRAEALAVRRETRRRRAAAIVIQRAVRARRQRIWQVVLAFRVKDSAARSIQAAWRNTLARRETARLLARIQGVVRQAMAVRRVERSVFWWLQRRHARQRLQEQRSQRTAQTRALRSALEQWAATRVQSTCRRWLARKRAAAIRTAQAHAVQRSVLQSWFGDAELLSPAEAANSLAPSLRAPGGAGGGSLVPTPSMARMRSDGGSGAAARPGMLSGPGAGLPVVSSARLDAEEGEVQALYERARGGGETHGAAAAAAVDPSMHGQVQLSASGRPEVPGGQKRGFTPTAFFRGDA